MPGNHDAYVRAALPYLASTFAPWSRGDAGETFPYLRCARGGGVDWPFLGGADLTADRFGTVGPSSIGEGGRALKANRARRADPRGDDPSSAASRRREIRPWSIRRGPIRGDDPPGRRRACSPRPQPQAFDCASAGTVTASPGHWGRLRSAIHDSGAYRASYNFFQIEGTQKSPYIRARMRGLLPGGREVGDLRRIVI